VFTKNVHIPSRLLPRYFALPIQGNNWCCSENVLNQQMHTNAGVILMNISALREVKEEFIEYVMEKILQNDVLRPAFNDQTAFHFFFPVRFTHLNIFRRLYLRMYHFTYFETLSSKYYSEVLPKEFEWEPYLGMNKNSVILHWHGPKVFFDHCAMLNRTPSSSLMQGNQVILKQLMLHNRTEFSVSIRARVFNQTNHLHGYSHTSDSASVDGIRVHIRAVGGGEVDAVSKGDGGLNMIEGGKQLYPPLYDWYSPMRLSELERGRALEMAEKSFHYLQTITKGSLDGYQEAVELFFAYTNIACNSQ
jgi:hypothetical protein